jgi:dihydrofolate reductase
VDGFIARPDGRLDWLPAGGGEEHGYEAFMATVDALVIGRHTYQTVLAFETWPYGKKPVFVLSTQTIPPAPPEAIVEHLAGTPHDIVAQLAARGFQHAYIDGGLTIQAFLQAGLIGRMVITRVPVLIGTGIPLFGPTDRDIRLRHLLTRSFASGLVQSEYEVIAPLTRAT